MSNTKQEDIAFTLPPVQSQRPLSAGIIRATLRYLPHSLRIKIYRSIVAIGKHCGWDLHPGILHLPLRLVLKISSRDPHGVEASALRFLETSIHGVNFPLLIDFVTGGDNTYTLSTYVEGDNVSDIYDDLSPNDWARLEEDLRDQLTSLRVQTSIPHRRICSAAGGIISDPRLPWVKSEFSSAQEFFRQVWLGLEFPHNRDTIKPVIEPVIDRPIPISFCHGDVVVRNFILPGGLAHWRSGLSRVCLIDWEFAGWMPEPWESLKSTFLEFEKDTEWIDFIRRVMPGYEEYLDADWVWRSQSRVMLI